MSRSFPLVAALVALGTLTSADSHAVTCYVVLDRSENVVYRDVYPPVDMSDVGSAEREAMRRRGEYLMFMESEQCPRLEFFTGGAGTVALRLEQTLAPSDTPSAAAKPAAPRAPRKAAPRKG